VQRAVAWRVDEAEGETMREVRQTAWRASFAPMN
jgi:hypothetical protein